MDISKLQGAQSFQVRPVNENTKREDLVQSLANNGKVDLVIEDESSSKLYVVSGDKIDLKELNHALGKALPQAKISHLNNREIRAAQRLDENEDGFLTEDELKYSKTEALAEGWDRFGKTVEGGVEVGQYKGLVLGMKVGSAIRSPGIGSKIGVGIGSVLGGIAGLAASPFTGASKAYEVSGNYQTPAWSGHFDGALRSIR